MMPKPAFALGFLVWSVRTIFFPFPTHSPAWAPTPVLLWRFVWPHETCFILIVPSGFFAKIPFPFLWPLAEMFTWLLMISVRNFMSLQRDMDVTPHKRELWPVDNSERKFHFRQLKYLCSAAWAFFVCVCVCLVLCSFITHVGSCDQHCDKQFHHTVPLCLPFVAAATSLPDPASGYHWSVLHLSDKWNHTECILLRLIFLWPSTFSKNPSELFHVSVTCSLFLLSNVPWCEWTVVCLTLTHCRHGLFSGFGPY